MRFKNRQHSQLPEVNLVPMMDVLMTVLTFFIIISMTLTTQQGIQVALPDSAATATPPQDNPDPLQVELTPQGIQINDRLIPESQLKPQVQSYLAQQTHGVVVLQADDTIPYEQVLQRLGTLKDLGGDRVSLAIE